MNTNTLPDPAFTLGRFLRDRRARLAPGPGTTSRRRTPGLRREEVATRAGVSVTWYTWLEQGRGGPPSDEVLERLARALELDPAGREILFLLAQQRPPPFNQTPTPPVAPELQRILDSMPNNPAIVKSPTWDIVAWNAAASAVLADYEGAPAEERNVLKRMFGDPAIRAALPDWESDARFAVAVFRIDVARSGGSPEAVALAAEQQATSADFRRMWAEIDVRSHWVGRKRLHRPSVGSFTLETMAFTVDGAEGLSMIVFSPVSTADAKAVAMLIAEHTRKDRGNGPT
jgi:transcriptional regulator with XRE-family HTH domain